VVAEKIIEAAVSISSHWFIAGMGFDEKHRKLSIHVDFEVRSRLRWPESRGSIPCMAP
jgi:hypothetical protein